jgi:hypothetical protein
MRFSSLSLLPSKIWRHDNWEEHVFEKGEVNSFSWTRWLDKRGIRIEKRSHGWPMIIK